MNQNKHIKNKNQAKKILEDVFGYTQFRDAQEAIINNVLANKDTFVLMPTGGGKSICYQIPAFIKEGTAIIISPLISLMKNQVDQLKTVGIPAVFLNSSLSLKKTNSIKKEILLQHVKLLYLAPEFLSREENIIFLKQIQISFIAIDEVHCISDWGHDFRPEYRNIRLIMNQKLGRFPIICLTATATPKVEQDIIKNLEIEDATVFKSSFVRNNLFYEIKSKEQVDKQLIAFITKHSRSSGIVYCHSRKTVEEVAALLALNNIKAVPYHAGLDTDTKENVQNIFLTQECYVIIATIAFGMGIDKSDIRFVVHYDSPKSLESYYQETGRAGRDGLPSHCLMFFNQEDIYKLEKLNRNKPASQREKICFLLQEVLAYAITGVCRRKQLLYYFGECIEENCNQCDNCVNPPNSFEGEKYVTIALKAVEQVKQNFSIEHLTRIIRGIQDSEIINYAHHTLPIFGTGKEKNKEFWHSVLRQALLYGLLNRDIEQIGTLQLTEKGRDFLKRSFSITLRENKEYFAYRKGTPIQNRPYDDRLYQLLKNLRSQIATEKSLPPYTILQNSCLEEMATTYPTTLQELSSINGLNSNKVSKIGSKFIKIIQEYVLMHNITTFPETVIKSNVNKFTNKVFIIQQIDRKADFDKIMSLKSISMMQLIAEMEQICYTGTKLDISYHIDRLLSKDEQAEIYNFFMQEEEDDLNKAIKELGNQFSEEEIRLMRIKFLSEVAN